jgi:hypothetical protein
MSASGLYAEFSIRKRLVESAGALLRMEGAPEEATTPYQRILDLNEDELAAIASIAEKRWTVPGQPNSPHRQPEVSK